MGEFDEMNVESKAGFRLGFIIMHEILNAGLQPKPVSTKHRRLIGIKIELFKLSREGETASGKLFKI